MQVAFFLKSLTHDAAFSVTNFQEKGISMSNLIRISRVNEVPGFPLRASTLYKWVHVKKHPELFVRLGGAVFVNVNKLDELIAKGGTR
jgi:hypothetical protein